MGYDFFYLCYGLGQDFCATSSRSGGEVGSLPHGILASSDDVGFPMFDLFEVNS